MEPESGLKAADYMPVQENPKAGHTVGPAAFRPCGRNRLVQRNRWRMPAGERKEV